MKNRKRTLAVTLCLSARPAVADPFTILISETPAQIDLRGDEGAERRA